MNEGFSHFSQDIGRYFGNFVTIFTQKPQNTSSRRGHFNIVNESGHVRYNVLMPDCFVLQQLTYHYDTFTYNQF